MKKTMFGRAASSKYAKIVKIDTPANARKALTQLRKEFKNAKRDDKKTRIVRVANLAANRCQALLQRKGISSKERKELREVRQLYRDFVNKHKKTR